MTPSEVQYLLSAPNAVSGYSSPGSVYNSNGAYASTTQIDTAVPVNNLFPDLTGVQNAAQQVDYQCLFVYNSDLSSSMSNVKVWIPLNSVTSSVINWAIAKDPTGVSNYNTIQQQALLIANPYIQPVNITVWTGPSADFSGGISLGTIGPRQVYPIWVRRTATGVAGTSAFNLQVTFDV